MIHTSKKGRAMLMYFAAMLDIVPVPERVMEARMKLSM